MHDWTAEELAAEADLTPRRIRGLCTEGRIEGAYKLAGAWFVPRELGQEWLEERKKAATSPVEEVAAS